jgi:phosphoglycerate dehydrogenase-like enzyme
MKSVEAADEHLTHGGAGRHGGRRDTVSAASSIDPTSGANVDVQRTGVIGSGVMGSGIAQMLAEAGCDVVCIDNDLAGRCPPEGDDR